MRRAALSLPLPCGRATLIDCGDLDVVRRYVNWFAYRPKGVWYVAAKEARTRGTVIMHRLIMGDPTGTDVDHINGDGLDNRRSNLRACTHQQNTWNARPRGGRAFKGTVFGSGRWRAGISPNGRRIYLGGYDTQEDAAAAYNVAAARLYGEFAWLNAVPAAPVDVVAYVEHKIAIVHERRT